jgi:hypothetical protein
MSSHIWGLAIGAVLGLLFCIAHALLRVAAHANRALDADLTAQRTPGMGDPAATVSPDEPTPIYDALAAERVIASADAVVAAEWDRAVEVYDVDDTLYDLDDVASEFGVDLDDETDAP